jgi:hypothetical protein
MKNKNKLQNSNQEKRGETTLRVLSIKWALKNLLFDGIDFDGIEISC